MTRFERIARVLYNRTFRKTALEARIREVLWSAEDDHLQVSVTHPQATAIALSLVEFFRDTGGVNYVAMRFLDPATLEAYELVVQRLQGRTPSQVNGDLDALLLSVYADPAQARERIDQAFSRWGKVPPKERGEDRI